MKIFPFIFLFPLVFIVGCGQVSPQGELEKHATPENVKHCFEDNAGDPYEDILEHCKEEICDTDIHCFEEVEEISQQYK